MAVVSVGKVIQYLNLRVVGEEMTAPVNEQHLRSDRMRRHIMAGLYRHISRC